MSDAMLPQDPFSQRLRSLSDNPGAVRASSTVPLQDFLGNSETWIIETFRVGGDEVVFLQHISASGSMRVVLPSEVTAAMERHRGRVVTQSRRRGARQAMATRLAAGHDPAAALKAYHRKTKKGAK